MRNHNEDMGNAQDQNSFSDDAQEAAPSSTQPRSLEGDDIYLEDILRHIVNYVVIAKRVIAESDQNQRVVGATSAIQDTASESNLRSGDCPMDIDPDDIQKIIQALNHFDYPSIQSRWRFKGRLNRAAALLSPQLLATLCRPRRVLIMTTLRNRRSNRSNLVLCSTISKQTKYHAAK